jgi:hypothetical protein
MGELGCVGVFPIFETSFRIETDSPGAVVSAPGRENRVMSGQAGSLFVKFFGSLILLANGFGGFLGTVAKATLFPAVINAAGSNNPKISKNPAKQIEAFFILI